MRSSPSRRSPRLAQHGLHPTPPAKSAEWEGARGKGVVSGVSLNQLNQSITPMNENGKERNHIETPDSGRVIPLRSTKTPTRPGVWSQLETLEGKLFSRKNVAGGHQIITRRTRRAAISPRTRGSAIVNMLASPGEFLASNTGNRRYVSPKSRSSAEATLHHLARARTRVNERSLDTGNGDGNHNNLPPNARKRRRRKAAAAAIDKVRSICQMDDFDDLENLLDIGQPSEKSTQGKDAASDVVGETETIQSASSSRSGDECPDSVESFKPKRKVEEKWLQNFKRWTSQQNDLPLESALTSSPLPKGWVKVKERENATKAGSNHVQANDNDKKYPREGETGIVEEKLEQKSKTQVKSKQTGKRGREASESNNGSLSKRKSPRKIFPTQFYHNLEAVMDKGEQKSKRRRNFKATKMRCSERGSKSTNESSAKTKPARESFSAQSYHNIDNGTSSSDKGKDTGANKSVPSPSKESKSNDEKEPQTVLGPKSSSHASRTAAKELSIPTKRRSTSTPNDSLASLPANVAKHEADKQRQGKKKKHRGRHSTSSLSALEAHSEASGKEVESDDDKRKISLSHKELQQQLSKSKKKPARKKADSVVAKKKIVKKLKSKTPNIEHADGDVGESDSSIAGKSALSGQEDWKADATGTKGNLKLTAAILPPSSPGSPLRATKLLPSLSNDRAPGSNHTELKSSGIDLTENSAEDMSQVCVTKLLLSCLSEDSTEKGTAHAVSTPAAEKGTPQEKNPYNDRKRSEKSSAPSLSNGVETDLFQTATSDVVLDQGAYEPSEKMSSSVKGLLTLHSPGDGKFSWRKKPTEEVKLWTQQEKISMTQFLRRSLAQETREEQMVTSKEADGHNPAHHEGEAAGCLSQTIQWTCDVCQEATFEDYDEAMAHERECARKAKSSLSNTEEENLAFKRKENLLIGDPVKLTPTLPQKGKVSVELDRLTTPDNKRINSWTCDICQEATFEDHEEAMAHERQCAATKNTLAKHSSSMEREEESEASKCMQIYRPVQESEMTTRDSRMHHSKTFSFTKGRSKGKPLSLEEADDKPINGWTCDICQEATFENDDDARRWAQGKSSLSKKEEEAKLLKKTEHSPTAEDPAIYIHKPNGHKFESSRTTQAIFKKPAVPQKKHVSMDPREVNSWTCDICQVAIFEDYNEAMAHERQCVAIKTTPSGYSSSIEGEEDDEASKCRQIDRLLEKSDITIPNSKTHSSKRLSVMKGSSARQPLSQEEADDEPINSWTCDICQEATFEDYDDAMAHERECIRIKNTQSKLSTPNDDGREEEAKTLKIVPNVERPEKPTSKSQRHKSRSLSSSAQQAQQPLVDLAGGVNANTQIESLSSTSNKQSTYCPVPIPAADVATLTGRPNNHMSKSLLSMKRNLTQEGGVGSIVKAPIHHPTDANSGTKPSSSTSNKPSIHSLPMPAALASGQAPGMAGNQDNSQSTPVQNKDPIDDFSPLSLTSSLCADPMPLDTHGIQCDSARSKENEAMFPPQLNTASPGQPAKPTTASITEITTEVANPSRLSLVPHSFPPGTKTSEPQLQLIVAEKTYQEKMAEFGRLELEAKMVTRRMREIEGRINGLNTSSVSNGSDNSNRLETSQKSYSESKSSSLQRNHSWSNCYESSEEGECSDEYYLQSKRGGMKSNMLSGNKSSRRAEEDRYERSANRVKVRSRSSRHEQGKSIRSSYTDSEIYVESNFSRRSKKVDHRQTERFTAPLERRRGYERPPKRHNSHYYAPATKKRSKGGDSTRKQENRIPDARSNFGIRGPVSELPSSKRKKRSTHRESYAEDVTPQAPRKHAARRQAVEQCPKKEAGPRSRKQSISRNQWREERSTPPKFSTKKSVDSLVNEPAEDDGDDKDSGTDSTKLQAGFQGWKRSHNNDGSKSKDSATDMTKLHAGVQGRKARDPLYWLAGGGNSSDDESWDFDGPMILPPPPL